MILFINENIYELKMSCLESYLGYINYNNKIDYDTLLKYVDKNAYIIQYIPRNFFTEELCLRAINNTPYAIEYIPNNMITYEMCLECIKKNPSLIKIICLKFPSQITHELCYNAVLKDGYVILDIPTQFMTEELCFLALRTNVRIIEYIKEEYKSKRICLYVIQKKIDLYGDIKEYVENDIEFGSYLIDEFPQIKDVMTPYFVEKCKEYNTLYWTKSSV